MANVNAITIPPDPITHVMSKNIVLDPLVYLCDKRRSMRYGIT